MKQLHDLPAPEGEHINVRMLADRWWTLALRGVAALAFGVLTLAWPRASLYAMVMLFGAYALVDGVFSLVLSVQSARHGRRWGSLVFAGLAGIAAGVLTFVLPGMTALVLTMLIAVWAIVLGVAEIAAAIRLRKHIRGEWLLGLTGALQIALGIVLFLFPAAGAFTFVIWIGAFAIAMGVVLIALGFRLRAWRRHGTDRTLPTGGMPSPAH